MCDAYGECNFSHMPVVCAKNGPLSAYGNGLDIRHILHSRHDVVIQRSCTQYFDDSNLSVRTIC